MKTADFAPSDPKPDLPSRKGPGGTTLAAWILAALFAGVSFQALANPFLGSRYPAPQPNPSWSEPGEPIPVEGTGWTPVLAKLENSEARVRRAWHNLATAQVLLTHARVRRYPRGEPFFKIRDRVIFLEAERTSSETQFLELVQQSRRAGMPAGTLSTFMDFSDEIERDRKQRASAVDEYVEP